MGKELFSVISAADIDSIPHYDIIDARDIELSGKTVKTLATAGLIAMTAAGCISPIKSTESPLSTPAAGEAVPVQALSAEEIEAITDSGVKNLFESDLKLGQEECAQVPGCIENSLLNYWINTNGGAFSYQFAGVEGGADPAHWVVLSAKDEKTKEVTDIKKDLLRKDGVMVDGIASTVFYYSDGENNDNYHLILVKIGGDESNSEYLVYGPDGKQYRVKQDSVASLSHLWESPKEVEAAPLPTETATTASITTQTETDAPTPTETATPTPEVLTVEDFKVVDGKIQENKNGAWQEVSVPTEMGEIAYVEEHEGKMYGIDTVERAIVVRNEAGEWVKFERPILGASFGDYYIKDSTVETTYSFKDYSDILFEDIPSDKIVRLNGNQSKPLDWGYQKGSYSWGDLVSKEADSLPVTLYQYYANFSGYFVGIVEGVVHFKSKTSSYTGKYHPYYVFEIPYKYERQIILLQATLGKTEEKFNVNVVDQNTATLKEISVFSGPDLNDFILNNVDTLRGKQIVVRLQANPPSPYNYQDYNSFWQGCINKSGYDVHTIFGFGSDIWLGSQNMP